MAAILLKPRQFNRSSHLAAATTPRQVGHRSYRSSCMGRRRHAALCCRQTPSHPTRTHDGPDEVVDNRLCKNPAGFHPSIWGDFFLHYSNPVASLPQLQVRMAERADKLKEEVATMIYGSSTWSLPETLHLIHVLQRLCLDHLFENAINDLLTQIKHTDVSGCDLQTVALWFYLLRYHGYRVSPDVFIKLKDEEGKFASNSLRDLLSLYNAAFLGTPRETILEEAISFSSKRLESALLHINWEGPLACEITRALEIPLPRRVRIYDVKYYISIHEKETTMNETILELSKLNSNLMQLHHQQELKVITRWWKNLQLHSNLSFSRDRIVECYFWMLGAYFEPCYSRARIILTMIMAVITIVDDTYDVYGTSKECDVLTKCFESWNPKVAQYLPENLKIILQNILHSYEVIEHELKPEYKYRLSYLKNVTIDWVRAYNTEVEWRDRRYIPATIEEHLQLSVRTGACHLLSCASFVGMGDIVTEESFSWVTSMPKMVHSLCIILRLLDDLESYEREQKMLHVASTVDSWMKELNISLDLAQKIIRKIVDEEWEKLNEEWLKPNKDQPKELLERIFNLARTMEFFYEKDDAYINSNIMKDIIHSLLVESFIVFY